MGDAIMNRLFLVLLSAPFASFLGVLSAAAADDAAKVKAIFADPPRQYASGPLWTWNDMLTEEHIRSTLRDLAGQKVKQVWVHPRPGLMTSYLSADWFRLWKIALDEAQQLDMNVWIYDENSYPSGFAGGLLPEAMPESRGRGLAFREEKQPAKPGDDVLAIFRLTDKGYENVTRQARTGQTLSEARYLVAYVQRAKDSPWFAGRCYVDLLYPGVTEKFLEITMEAYRREIGDQFGKHCPGVFTDEPQIRPAGGVPWTDHLPDEFQKRWGYSLIDHLPGLTQPLGDWKRVRHNYFQVLSEQFIEHWAKPNYEYCQRHGLEFTGHYWEHEWPNCIGVPDNMAMYAWQQRPGIDVLFNRYDEGTHAQFGNVRSVKELASVANQLGRKRTISETFGGSGWDTRFEDIKRQGDWEYVLGVNTLNECISFISIRGVRKGDYPQSLSYHEPWWDAYHVLEGYFTRLSVALSEGEQINRILIIEPTTTAWMYQGDARLGPIGDRFQKIVTALAKAQVEYDIGCEYIMGRHGSVEGAELVVGQRRYHTVVLSPLTENLNTETMKLLQGYAKAGGTVFCCGPPPALVDAKPSDRGQVASRSPTWKQVEGDDGLAKLLVDRSEDGFAVRRAEGDRGILFHHRRRLDDGELLFLVNTSITSPSSGVIESRARGAERWVLETGKVESYPFAADAQVSMLRVSSRGSGIRKNSDGTPARTCRNSCEFRYKTALAQHQSAQGIKAGFTLPPCGSLLLFLSQAPREPAPPEARHTETVPSVGSMQIRRIQPNVLTLDYMDVTVGDETKKGAHCRQASQFVFAKHGLANNPWFHAIQFRDEHLKKTFPPDSGFKATYRFTVKSEVPKKLQIVIERPDLYTITCNGKPVTPEKDAWWLDRAFGRINLAAAAQVGENAVTIRARPFTVYHELEPAYLLGEFTLEPADSGFVVAPDAPLELADHDPRHTTEPNGNMWLSGGIGFRPELLPARKDDGDPFIVFDLGALQDLKAIKIFNYNEPKWTKLGVKQLAISGSTTGKAGSFAIDIGTFDIRGAAGLSTGSNDGPQTLRTKARGVRFVKFDVLSNHNGVTFPARDNSKYFAMVGLSEVQFFGAPDGSVQSKQIPGVAVAKVSSELSIPGFCDRRANFLVDGSGLSPPGWNRQGHPFYAAGVAYSQRFETPRPSGRYRVELPAWYGSVAKVMVNGNLAGHIAYQPWQCDVTKWIRPGANTIQVVVIGTLKNTLGPHHAGAVRGFASPHIFDRAPAVGPPPGKEYDTIGYGLFQPFVLQHAAR